MHEVWKNEERIRQPLIIEAEKEEAISIGNEIISRGAYRLEVEEIKNV